VARFKARWAVKGYARREGIDFQGTLALASHFNGIRTFLSVAAMEEYEIRQLDIKTAFLNGRIERELNPP
jgi:hypothetical protein